MGMEPQARCWGAAVLGLYVVPEDFIESLQNDASMMTVIGGCMVH